jgi:hypothetical protein
MIGLPLRFAMLCPCCRVVFVWLARLYNFIVIVGHVIAAQLLPVTKSDHSCKMERRLSSCGDR